MKAKDYVGKINKHYALGHVKIMSVVEKSRTMVNIIVVQRAKGWCSETGRYNKILTIKSTPHGGKSLRWDKYSDKNSQFGHIDVCHIKDLIPAF